MCVLQQNNILFGNTICSALFISQQWIRFRGYEIAYIDRRGIGTQYPFVLAHGTWTCVRYSALTLLIVWLWN